MSAPRSRVPNESAARQIAQAIYGGADRIDWIPSDDADVFRMTFAGGPEPRILKMATHGIGAVWRELGAFPAMRELGIVELLEFEHTSDDLPEAGVHFHITPEIGNPQVANQTLATTWATDQGRAHEIARWLGDCTSRVAALDWRAVPRAVTPEGWLEMGRDWREPQYAKIAERPDCPRDIRQFLDEMRRRSATASGFGGWLGEMLEGPSSGFVLIDWPGLGAAPSGSQAAVALEILLRFRAVDPGPLVESFLVGFAPRGVAKEGLEDLRAWWAHNIIWWAGLALTIESNPDIDLAQTYADAAFTLATDDPRAWMRRAGAAAMAGR